MAKGSLTRRFLGWSLCALFIAVAAIGLWQRQFLSDWLSASQFSPSQKMSQVTKHLALTDAGQRVFYATHPEVSTASVFAGQCSGVKHVEQSHILGCYKKDQIFLLRVDDKRLAGIVEVTAAHELLHAVWARLGETERATLSKILQKAYRQETNSDTELEKRMRVYKDLSKADFVDELHSVFATEVQNLPPTLEKHYAEWFTSRKTLLSYYAHSYGVFREIAQKSTHLQKQMKELRSWITAAKNSYSADLQAYNSAVDDLLARNNRYEFSDNPGQFAILRNQLLEKQQDLLKRYEEINQKVQEHNSLRAELLKLQELNNSLQSKLDTEISPSPTRPDHSL